MNSVTASNKKPLLLIPATLIVTLIVVLSLGSSGNLGSDTPYTVHYATVTDCTGVTTGRYCRRDADPQISLGVCTDEVCFTLDCTNTADDSDCAMQVGGHPGKCQSGECVQITTTITTTISTSTTTAVPNTFQRPSLPIPAGTTAAP